MRANLEISSHDSMPARPRSPVRYRRRLGARARRFAWLAGSLILGAIGCMSRTPAHLETVGDFDPTRYVGVWNQVAAIPAWFQADCVARTGATYSMRDDGTIDVVNTCETSDGTEERAEGRARFIGSPEEGRLKVTFARLLGFWLWLAAGDYWVLDIGPDYCWAVVGVPSRNYAWVLAREPSLDLESLRSVASSLRRAGYDTCRVELTMPDRQGRLCDVVD